MGSGVPAGHLSYILDPRCGVLDVSSIQGLFLREVAGVQKALKDVLALEPETVTISILAGGEGLGLRTMRYRADRVGGEFEVRHREGGGTVVAVTFEPAQAEEEE